QYHADDAAVHIGQAFLEVGLNGAAHVSRHLAHGVQQSHQGVGTGDVQPEAGGELVHAGLGGLQGRQGGQRQNGRHADGQGGKQGNPEQIAKKLLPSPPAADLIHKEQQENKNAGKQANVVVGEN